MGSSSLAFCNFFAVFGERGVLGGGRISRDNAEKSPYPGDTGDVFFFRIRIKRIKDLYLCISYELSITQREGKCLYNV